MNRYSAAATALMTGIYFSLAQGPLSLATIPATAGDILYSPLGGGPVVVATLAGGAPATDINLGISGFDLDALNCVASAPGVLAPGMVGPTVASGGGGSNLLEFSISYGGSIVSSHRVCFHSRPFVLRILRAGQVALRGR